MSSVQGADSEGRDAEMKLENREAEKRKNNLKWRGSREAERTF